MSKLHFPCINLWRSIAANISFSVIFMLLAGLGVGIYSMRSAPSAGSAVASAPREIGYRQALRMAEIGRTQEALALFERIASSPRTASVIEPQTGLSLRERATYQSALCLKTLGRREEAIRAIQRLLSTRPSPIIRRQCERQLKRLHRGEANHAAFE